MTKTLRTMRPIRTKVKKIPGGERYILTEKVKTDAGVGFLEGRGVGPRWKSELSVEYATQSAKEFHVSGNLIFSCHGKVVSIGYSVPSADFHTRVSYHERVWVSGWDGNTYFGNIPFKVMQTEIEIENNLWLKVQHTYYNQQYPRYYPRKVHWVKLMMKFLFETQNSVLTIEQIYVSEETFHHTLPNKTFHLFVSKPETGRCVAAYTGDPDLVLKEMNIVTMEDAIEEIKRNKHIPPEKKAELIEHYENLKLGW